MQKKSTSYLVYFRKQMQNDTNTNQNSKGHFKA